MPKFLLPTVYKHFYDVEPIFTTRKVRTTKAEIQREIRENEKMLTNVKKNRQ
jgi:hypothetical protein